MLICSSKLGTLQQRSRGVPLRPACAAPYPRHIMRFFIALISRGNRTPLRQVVSCAFYHKDMRSISKSLAAGTPPDRIPLHSLQCPSIPRLSPSRKHSWTYRKPAIRPIITAIVCLPDVKPFIIIISQSMLSMTGQKSGKRLKRMPILPVFCSSTAFRGRELASTDRTRANDLCSPFCPDPTFTVKWGYRDPRHRG